MFALKSTSETLELLTSSTAGIDYSVTYLDFSAAGVVKSTSEGKITSATTTQILAAPATDTVRSIEKISIRNISGSVSNSVTVKKDISATDYFLTSTTPLAFGEVLEYENGFGWRRLDADGLAMGTGTTGANGSVIHNGSGAPSGGTGVDGDYYIDTASGDMYTKSGGSWSFLFTLSGGGGSSLTQVVVAADANITAAANTILVIPHGIMTANRTINIDALASDTDELHIFNHERTYSITFAGSHTIYTYGNEVYDNTEALRVAPFKLIRLNSELRQNT